MSEKEHKALLYAEEHGIIDYKVKGNRMIYYENHAAYLDNPRYTIKVTIRLDTMQEERQKLTKYRN